ncbi:aspartate aminotransferase family protein [Benzoatithermus flavus]|uniref:Acetylornithine aminotransferase n=1 Tax=Benzoatithermus flavus TaxID=3108223 RepID=A0ABU8XQX5_9PROT
MDNKALPSLLPVYKRYDLAFERGEGAWLYTVDGRRMLDFASGIAVTGLGHAHPHLVQALTDQAHKLWHVSNLFRIPELERLADRLVAHSFADTVFVCNSGAEAMEACIKMVRRYHWANGRPERHRIVTFEGAFHGRTMATISAAGSRKLVEGFDPLLPGFDVVPFGDHEALKAAIGPETAAIMIEPIQGEGGIRPVPRSCLEGLRRLCDEHGLLLVFDEVQAGMGRTGTLFAYEQTGVAPDIAGIAKGLGGGFPVGACLATARAAAGMTTGAHGSTFGGNPLACAVANAVLDVLLEEGFLERVAERGRQLQERLLAIQGRHPGIVAEVRGIGLLAGIRIADGSAEFLKLLQDKGLVTAPAADNVVRLLPPLIVSEAELDEGCAMIEAACREFVA